MLQSNSQAMAQALSSASSHGDWRLLFIQRDRIAAVTASDVNRVAKAYFQKPNRTVGLYIPAKESTRLAVPNAPAIDLVVKDYKGGTVGAAGEAFDPSPANLDSRIKLVKENGLKAGLLHKKNRGETVSLVLTLHYGTADSLKDQTTAAGMLPGLMMAGTKKHDRQSLRETLDSLGIRIGTGGGGGGRGGRGGRGGGGGTAGQLTFSVQAKRDTLPQALALLGEILREPAFPAAEFETSRLRMTSMLSAGRTEPGALARNKLSRALSPYSKDDVRYVPTLEETVERVKHVTLEQIKAVYQTQIGGSHAELGVVGDFDPESTLRLVKEMLSGWESTVPFKRIDRKVADHGTGMQRGHRHARQVERGIPGGSLNGTFRQRPRLPRVADRQLHLRRQHARLAAGRPNSAEGWTFLWCHLFVRCFVSRSSGLADGDRQHQPGEHRQGLYRGHGRTTAIPQGGPDKQGSR